MQTITDDLRALLKSKLQVGAGGYRGRIEIDWVLPGYTEESTVVDLALLYGAAASDPFSTLGTMTSPGNTIDGNDSTSGSVGASVSSAPTNSERGVKISLSVVGTVTAVRINSNDNRSSLSDVLWYSTDGGSTWAGGRLGVDIAGTWSPALGSVQDSTFTPTTPIAGVTDVRVDRRDLGSGLRFIPAFTLRTVGLFGTAEIVHAPEIRTATYSVASIGVDRSRKVTAAQLDVLLTNQTALKGYYTEVNPIFVTNNPVRAYEWYGDDANEVEVFRGLLDRVHEHREPRTIALTARGRMKWLLEQGYDADKVFASMEISDIVAAILDDAGWPSADRDLTPTGVTLSSYTVSADTKYASAIVGDGKLTAVASFDFWEDELGVIHFGPNALASDTEPDADYTIEAGVDALALDHEADDIDLVTRVIVSGPLTSAVPAWKQTWSTTKLTHPTGLMYVPAESSYLYAVDRITQYLYKIRQSDRAIVAKWPLGASLSYQPLGLSADPSDATIFWVLDAMWRDGASTHAKVHKFDLATKAHLASYSLPDGDWSDLKSDGSNLWLTNFGDDKLYKRTLTATAVADYSYAGHANPTGMYIDGTTIGLFFNGGQAFYKVDTSAPGTITGTQSTKGTSILGGEIDTTTHTDLYASNEAGDFGATAGHIWKFALATLVTTDVTTTSADQDLEDALGLQSGIGDRVHDLHPLDAAHPFEARTAKLSLDPVLSLAQAQAVGDAYLVQAKRVARVMDLGVVGNPALQINDVIRYLDPVSGIDSKWLLDTMRSDMSDGYTAVISVIPWEA